MNAYGPGFPDWRYGEKRPYTNFYVWQNYPANVIHDNGKPYLYYGGFA